MANFYNVTINGIDRTKDVLYNTMHLEDVLNDRQSTGYLSMTDRFGIGWPDNEQEIIITDANGTRVFGGIIITRTFLPKSSYGFGTQVVQINFQDYVRLLDRHLVNKVYQNMTDQAVITDIVNTFASDAGLDLSNVGVAATISMLKFNYQQPSQALRKITDNTGYNWYIDYFKKLWYFPNNQNAAPFEINTSTDSNVFNLNLIEDNSQLRNRVYVRGATRLSDTTTFSTIGDGTTTQFVLPNVPHDKSSVVVKVNGTTKTVGVVNQDTSGFDWYVDLINGYVQQDAGGTILISTDTLEVSYVYDVPIIAVVEDSASIEEYGVHEYEIQDKTITQSQAAIDRAVGELSNYGATLNEGSFSTYTPGLRSGQIITIIDNNYAPDTNWDDNEVLWDDLLVHWDEFNPNNTKQYVIQKVIATPIGGGYFKYDITLASAKMMGIIRFLIEMLETQQNQVDITDNEVLDNLRTFSDTISESDSLSHSSDTPVKNWATDALDTTDAEWDLFQWD